MERTFLLSTIILLCSCAQGRVNTRWETHTCSGTGCELTRPRQIFDLTYKLGVDNRHPAMFNASGLHDSFSASRYATRTFCAEEEASTHLISPNSVLPDKWPVEGIPPDRLIAPLVVIRFKENRNIEKFDIEHWENQHAAIEPGSVVLLDSDWPSVWDDRPERRKSSSQPIGFAADACNFLSLKNVYGVGVDTPYIDGAQYREGRMPCRLLLADANIYVLQNVRIDSDVPDFESTIFIAPLKMQSALASPCRIIAVYVEEEE